MSIALHYGKVACRIWEDDAFRKLSDQGQLLVILLLTAKEVQGGPPGLWCASDFTVLDKLSNFDIEALRNQRRAVIDAGMLRHDAEHRLWWVVKAVRVKYNRPDNQGVASGWARKLADFERCSMLDDYLRAILSESHQWPESSKDHPREMFLAKLRDVGIDPDAYDSETSAPQGELALEAPAPAPKPGNGAKASRAKVLPFRAQEALDLIAAASGGRFVASNPGRQAIEIERVIKEHPDRSTFEELGHYLAAGGENYADVLDSRWVTRRNFDAALGRARARGAANSDGYQDE